MENNETTGKKAHELIPRKKQKNGAQIVGVLRRAPRIKQLQRGMMASFALEVPRTFPMGDDLRQEISYVPVVAFDALAKQAEEAAQGSVVSVTGPLKTFAGKNGSGWQVRAESIQVVSRPAAAAAAA